MEFKRYRIEEIGTVVGGGTPSTKNPNYYGGNIPWITPKDLANYEKRYIQYGERNITDEGLKHSSAKLVPANTILMTSRAPIGYLAIAANEVSTNQGFKSIICDEKVVSPKFLYYLLQYEMENIKSLGTGSTFSEISGKVVKNIEVNLPNIENQKKIEDVLDAIDEKIETNQYIIANLEELSQTLFKRWFVDFEFSDENGNPYKSSGGEMTDSELGEIPKAWRVETLEKLGSIVGGGTPSKKNKEYYTNNGIPWITPKDLSKNRNIYISHGENDISELGLNKSSAKLLEKNSVLFSSRAPIGYIAINNIPVTTNQGFKSIVPNEEINPYFIYFILKNITPLIEQTASGSTFKEISAKGMKSIKIVFPSIELIKQYGNIIKKYFEEINFLENQNIKLIELRDTLLPKLMSGELEISDDIEVNSDELSI
ncbi:TPA: restriction endonuclease subunit S [Staphylococcus aureus]